MSDLVQVSGDLKQIVTRLVDGLHPQRIYMFGSQASGQTTKESDFDLLVVVPESDLPRHQREALSYDLLWGITTPVDVIVLTKEEFDQTSHAKTSLAFTVKAKGKVLYDRT